MGDLTTIRADQFVGIVGTSISGAPINPITSANNGNSNNQLLHIQTPDTTAATTALGALNASINIPMAGLASAGFQLNAGTLVGTLTPQCSLDGGTTWINCSFYDPSNSSIQPNITFSSSNTFTALSILPIGGASHVQVTVSSYTSGSATALMRASLVTGAAGAITAAAFGTISNNTVSLTKGVATQILAANSNRKYAYISNNSGSTVAIQFGNTTGLVSTAAGLVIPTGSFYELKGNNLYTGLVYAFTANNGVSLAVTEGTP